MKFKRLRDDWPQLVYKFSAFPNGELPQWYWNHIEAQEQTWNKLVEYRNGLLEESRLLSKTQRKPIWAVFFEKCKKIIEEGNLGWEMEGELLARFVTSHSETLKKGLPLRERTKENRKKILLVHRFTGGGMPVSEFFTQTGWRVQIVPPNTKIFRYKLGNYFKQFRTAGSFNLTKEEGIPFATVITRELPPEGVIKKIYWVGRFDRTPPQRTVTGSKRKPPKGTKDGWSYSIQFVIERPPFPNNRTDTSLASIDFGWRVMNDRQYIRIGMVCDTRGRKFEIRLPLQRKESHARAGLRKHIGNNILYDSYLGLTDLQAYMDQRTNATKDELEQVLDEDWMENFSKIRQKGLFSMHNEMIREEYQGKGREILDEWRTTTEAQLWIYHRQMQRLVRMRKIAYWNIANWLTQSFKYISWEGDLKVKELAEISFDKSPIRINAGKFRHWAAIGDLRQTIVNSCRKNDAEMINEKAEKTTRICWECREEIQFPPYPGSQKPSDLYLECPNGHKHDQDYNACMNLLGFAQEHLEKRSIYPIENVTTIPDHLQGYVVEVLN